MEHNSQPVAERSLPTSTSNGPVKLRITSREFTHCSGGSGHIDWGEKETRDNGGRAFSLGEGRYHEIIAPMKTVLGPSHDLTPSETWNPDETAFMEGPHLTRDISKSKSRGGDTSVDTIKPRLIRATSTL